MVRMMSKLQKKKAAAHDEERASLVGSASPTAASSRPVYSSFAHHWKRLLAIVVAGCFVLFLWESIEIDQTTGDVQLKLYSGNKEVVVVSGQVEVEKPAEVVKTVGDSSGEKGGEKAVEDEIKQATETPPPAVVEDETTPAAAEDTPPDTPADTPPDNTDTDTDNTDTTTTTTTTEETQTEETPPGGGEETRVETEPPTEPAAAPEDIPLEPPPPPLQFSCDQLCETNDAKQFFNGQDLTSAKLMQQRLAQYRQEWIDTRLKPDYGDYYHSIFMAPNGEATHVGQHNAFKEPKSLPRPGQKYDDVVLAAQTNQGPGWNRMVRKYTLKLLQVQLGMLHQSSLPAPSADEQQACKAQCQSNPDDEQHASRLYGKFVWATGGHSASAGHGNFYRESYTANLGRDVQPILQQIGLEFEVRNYAMGGTESGEEVALCFNQIFGRDIDSISWDYGMTDGHEHYKMAMYSMRAARLALLEDSVTQPGVVRHRPSLISIYQNDINTELLQTLQDLGMTVLGMDNNYLQDKVIKNFPDMFGMTDAQIDAIPPFVKYFKCNDKIEAGDPGCAEYKFNHTICEKRRAQNTWHPGWRNHALIGHLLAFTVLQVITEALDNLIQMEPAGEETPEQKQDRLTSQLQKLNDMEQQDYEAIFNTPLPDNIAGWFNSFLWKANDPTTNATANKEAMKDVLSFDMLTKDPSMCHTAMLPAEIRYKGILTENFEEVGGPFDYAKFEHATYLSKVKSIEIPGANMNASAFSDPHPGREEQMALLSADEEWEDWCDEQTNVDHKDYFYISSEEPWRKLTIPNNAEKQHYPEFSAEKSHGWILICMAKCDWGHCAEGDVRSSILGGTLDGQEYGQIFIQVNNVPVTDVKCMNVCCALLHDDPDPRGRFRWTPNGEGKYEFRTMISNATKYSYARYSSFILL